MFTQLDLPWASEKGPGAPPESRSSSGLSALRARTAGHVGRLEDAHLLASGQPLPSSSSRAAAQHTMALTLSASKGAWSPGGAGGPGGEGCLGGLQGMGAWGQDPAFPGERSKGRVSSAALAAHAQSLSMTHTEGLGAAEQVPGSREPWTGVGEAPLWCPRQSLRPDGRKSLGSQLPPGRSNLTPVSLAHSTRLLPCRPAPASG